MIMMDIYDDNNDHHYRHQMISIERQDSETIKKHARILFLACHIQKDS